MSCSPLSIVRACLTTLPLHPLPTGSKLGGFNERMRDGALGGGPFSPAEFQGFATGLALQPNRCRDQGSAQQQMQV